MIAPRNQKYPSDRLCQRAGRPARISVALKAPLGSACNHCASGVASGRLAARKIDAASGAAAEASCVPCGALLPAPPLLCRCFYNEFSKPFQWSEFKVEKRSEVKWFGIGLVCGN